MAVFDSISPYYSRKFVEFVKKESLDTFRMIVHSIVYPNDLLIKGKI